MEVSRIWFRLITSTTDMWEKIQQPSRARRALELPHVAGHGVMPAPHVWMKHWLSRHPSNSSPAANTNTVSAISFGSARRLARCFWRPAENFPSRFAHRGPVSETPTGATGKVALHISTKSFSLKVGFQPETLKTLILFLVFIAALVSTHGADSKKSSGADALFREPTVRTFHIDVAEAGLAALKQSNRDYVRAAFRDGDVALRDVGIRLKGHGTFQPIDKKPAFALKFNEFISGQEYRGLTKLVLNNSAQDRSFMREWLAAELYHDAGIPAARVTHARVLFNGRDLGFYVLVEAMNKSFLKREFGNGGGNLYEGESRDIDQKLDQENGDDTSQNDLKALVAAAKAPAAQRLQKLRALLDVDEFASFLAMEMLTASTGGYTFMRNNYRVFHHPKADKLMFLPHGLDAAFGSAGFTPPTNSVLVKALWELPDFQKQYQASLHELAAKIWRVDVITNRVNTAAAKLINAASGSAMANEIEHEAKRLRYQIEQQAHFIAAEIKRAAKN